MSVRVAVIGTGYLGRHHARVYSQLEGAELAAVADLDQTKAEEIASLYGCRPYEDFRRAIEDVQAVSIVTPTSTHFDVAMHCLKAGKDVLLEKPITATVEEADRLIEEAEKRGVLIQVGHLERYNPAVEAVSGMVSRPRLIESERLSPFLGRGTDVDVTLDLMIHDIDIVMSLLEYSPVRDLRVVGASVLTGRVDVAKAWIEFENGVAALIAASRVSGEKLRRLRLYQEDSHVVLDYISMGIKKYTRSEGGIATETLSVEPKEPLMEEIRDFLSSVERRRRPRVSGVEGRKALEVALDITKKIMARA